MDVEITELEKIEADRVDGVGTPANGIPILLMKAVAEPESVTKDGARDCPKCGKNYHADHKGNTCENCGAKLPDGDDAEKSADDREAAKSLCRAIIAKAVGADGEVDEEPDIKGGTEVLSQIADLIIAEATELKAGQAGEIADILELACAAQAIWCWRTGEEAVGSGSVMPATALMQSAAKEAWRAVPDIDTTGWPKTDADFFELFKLLTLSKAKHSAADRRKLAEEGNALSDGSYPIADEHDLKSAAILAQSGHGDVEGAKRLIARRAKELGVKNPLEDGEDTSKSQIAEGETTVDTVTKGTGDLAEIVEAAVTKAVQPHMERITQLEAELAKVKATPVPGGPVMSAVAPRKTAPDGEEWAAKAAYYEAMADTVSQDPNAAAGYRQLARQAREKAKTA